MSLKENLLQKIEIDRLARQVIDSIRPQVGSSSKIDKQAMVRLFEIAAYNHEHKRDLDLYYRKEMAHGSPSQFIVLDNDLAVYATTMEDVVMRKSPYVKEMISIRNIIKILNDGDVIRSKKADTVKLVHGQCLSTLDLTISPSGLFEIRMEGTTAVASGDTEAVLVSLALFAELLRYRPAPPFLVLRNYHLLCGVTIKPDGVSCYGPHVMYDATTNRLKLSTLQIKNGDTEKIETFHQVAQDTMNADREGGDVFTFLHEAAVHVTSLESTI